MSKLVKRPAPFDVFGLERKYSPTDRLAIVVSRHPGGDFELVDDGKKRVEDHLNALLHRLYKSVVILRQTRREDEARAKRQEIYRAERARIAQQQTAEAEVKAHEEAARAQLLHEASQWHLAQQLRSYVAAAAEVHARGPKDPIREEWLQWASKVAGEIDPLADLSPQVSSP